MKRRLTELLNKSSLYDMEIADTVDYLLNEGIIAPPCKVGDIVYVRKWWNDGGEQFATFQITNMMITQSKKGKWTKKYTAFLFTDGRIINIYHNFIFDEVGVDVFTTLEEAERKSNSKKDG